MGSGPTSPLPHGFDSVVAVPLLPLSLSLRRWGCCCCCGPSAAMLLVATFVLVVDSCCTGCYCHGMHVLANEVNMTSGWPFCCLHRNWPPCLLRPGRQVRRWLPWQSPLRETGCCWGKIFGWSRSPCIGGRTRPWHPRRQLSGCHCHWGTLDCPSGWPGTFHWGSWTGRCKWRWGWWSCGWGPCRRRSRPDEWWTGHSDWTCAWSRCSPDRLGCLHIIHDDQSPRLYGQFLGEVVFPIPQLHRQGAWRISSL